MYTSSDSAFRMSRWVNWDRASAPDTSRFAVQSMRWITPDVALVDAVDEQLSAGWSRDMPVLFVLRKEAGVWKIASIRVISRTGPGATQ